MINLYDKWYVGIQKRTNDDNMLGFVTQDTGDANFEGRKTTVDNWVNGSYSRWNNDNSEGINPEKGEGRYFDNVPTTGFTFESVESRYRTDNKWFRVIDPRGWMIEISTYNLFSILMHLTVEQGEIKAPLIYGKDKQTIYLTWEGNPQNFTVADAVKIKRKDLKVGNKVLHGRESYTYVGPQELIDYSQMTYGPRDHDSGWYNDYKPKLSFRAKYPNEKKELLDLVALFEAQLKDKEDLIVWKRKPNVIQECFMYHDGEELRLRGHDGKTFNLVGHDDEIDLSTAQYGYTWNAFPRVLGTDPFLNIRNLYDRYEANYPQDQYVLKYQDDDVFIFFKIDKPKDAG